MDIEQYEQYRFLGTVYEYMINYLSHEELATGQCDPDLVFQESTDYLLLQEMYLEEESNSSYTNVFEDLEFDSYSEVIPYEQYDFLVYEYMINYVSLDELATGQCDPDLVYQESTEYLLQQEIYPEEERYEGIFIPVY